VLCDDKDEASGSGPGKVWEAADSEVKVRVGNKEVAFLLGGADDPAAVANVDIEIRQDGGRRWGATLLTPAEIARLLDRWGQTGESFC
jgi:hypothetical protein